MLHQHIQRHTTRRRANILMVAIVLLTLFLAVGLCFVLLAQSHATSSRIYREASLYLADKYPSPEELAGWALGEIIYDSQDGQGGQSAAYGWGLARNMYGWYYTQDPSSGAILAAPNPAAPAFIPTLPYNGVPFSGAGRQPMLRDMINYMNIGGVARRPEWLQANGSLATSDQDVGAPMFFTGGFNPGYTYPDLNHLYLAKVLADGTVQKPSFWPGDLNGFGPADPSNANMTNGALQRYCLRPLNDPALNPNFPTIGAGGDVRNRPLTWGGAGNDSVWIDLGYPVITLATSGRKVKPLFAFLVVDLDGRINLNGTGNLRGNPSSPPYPPGTLTDTHTSHQGWARTEINPMWLGMPLTEMQKLFYGDSSINLNGRYGLWTNLNTQPKPTPTHPNTRTTPGEMPRYYGRGDWDASTMPVQTGAPDGIPRMLLPPALAGQPTGYFSSFPFFGNRFGDGQNFEAAAHPMLFNPFMLNRVGSAMSNVNLEKDRLFPISDMRWLMAFNNATEIQNADVAKLAATFISNMRRQQMITMHACDLDLMGAAPGQLTGGYLMPAPADPNPISFNRTPQGGPSSFSAQLSTRGVNPNPGGDFVAGDWRSQLAAAGRVDLNRPLTSFPPAPTNGNYYQDDPMSGQLFLTQAIQAQAERIFMARDIFARFKFATGVQALTPADYPAAANSAGSNVFETHRYLAQLAVNIVDYVDADEYSTPFNWDYPNSDQLAGTPVNQHTWVFGTELPRLVINEVYAQVQNAVRDDFSVSKPFVPGSDSDPDTTPASPGGGMGRPFASWNAMQRMNARATQPYQVNFYVELHHPHNADPNQGEQPGPATRSSEERLWFNQANQAAYRVVIRSSGDNMGTPVPVGSIMNAVWNVTGDPNAMPYPSRINRVVDDYTTDPSFSAAPDPDLNVFAVRPSNGQYGDRTANDANNRGYYVCGPWEAGLTAAQQSYYRFPHDRGQPPPVFGSFGATMANQRLYATLDHNTTPTGAFDSNDPMYPMLAPQYRPTVVLQRRACPYLPPQDAPANGAYNPFVTVDYVENIPINDALLVTGGMTPVVRDGAGTNGQRAPLNMRQSVGRRQPLRAQGITPQSPQETDPATMMTGPFANSAQHTFFRQNGQSVPGSPASAGTTLDYPFEWLTHLDRQTTNTMELLHVSGHKPHHLTQLSINQAAQTPPGPADLHQHRAPWRIGATRLYRCLEMLGTRDRMEASAFGGKVMGKVNINTITELEVFRAVCDAATGNYFTPAQVDALWSALVGQRSPSATGPSPADRPFWSLAMPNDSGAAPDAQYPQAGLGGQEKCLFRTNAGAPLFDVPGAPHPFLQNEILQKIGGHLTTRSNVFALWCTTGFFEVENTFQQPQRLGAEVDVRMRHKFFAVIDRTNLTLDWQNPRAQGPRPIFFPFKPSNGSSYHDLNLADATIDVPNVLRATGVAPFATLTLYDSVAHGEQSFLASGFPTPYTYDIRPGSYLVLGSGDNKEVVRVTECYATTPPRIRVTRTGPGRRHFAGEALCTQRLGNPGPQPVPIDYTAPNFAETVVPYFVIVQ